MSCVKTGSFSGASKELSMTHQAVSRNIRKIEDELGYKLFIRDSQSVSLTKAGEFLRSWLTEMDTRLGWSSDYFYNEGNFENPRIRVAFVDWVGLPKRAVAAIERMKSDVPDLQVELHTGSESFLFRQLKNRKTDLLIVPGVVSFMPEESSDIFTNLLFCKEMLRLVCGKAYVDGEGVVDYDRLLSKKMLVFDHGRELEQQIERLYRHLCETNGREPAGMERIPNFHSVVSEIVMENGFAFVPRGARIHKQALPHLGFAPLDDMALAEIPLSCIWRPVQGSEQLLRYIEALDQ
jgi:DNA-binding transcriptional LysR family regulator